VNQNLFQVDPFNMYEWWNLILSAPYNLGRTEPLKDLLAQYMWRTSKVDVESQVKLLFFLIVLNLVHFYF